MGSPTNASSSTLDDSTFALSHKSQPQSPLVVINNFGVPGNCSVYYAPLPCGYYPASPAPMRSAAAPYLAYSPCVYYPQEPAQPACYFALAQPPLLTPPCKDTQRIVVQLLENVDKALCDQSSCRMIQKYLEDNGKTAVADELFSKMIVRMDEYMNLPFGNYLCQKLFELLDGIQLHAIIGKLQPQVVSISNNLHGTRSIQKLISRSAGYPNLKEETLKLLVGHVAELATVLPLLYVLLCRTLMGTTWCSNTWTCSRAPITTSSIGRWKPAVSRSPPTSTAAVLCRSVSTTPQTANGYECRHVIEP